VQWPVRDRSTNAQEALAEPQPDRLSIFVLHAAGLLTDHAPHGDGLMAHSFITRLAERGHRLRVAVPAVDLERPLPPTVRLHELRAPGRGGTAVHYGQYMRTLRRLVRQVLAEERVDVFLQLNPVMTGISLALPRTGIPLVLGPYVPAWPPNPDRDGVTSRLAAVARVASKRLVGAAQQRRAAALVVAAPAARERLHGRGRNAVVREVPLGVDARQFSPHGAPGPGSSNQILFVGKIVAEKGVDPLMAAFTEVARRSPDATLVVSGHGAKLNDLKAWIAREQLEDRVRLTGAVSRADVRSLLRDSAIFCLPSFGEPMAVSVIEAMATGRPIVTTNAGGMPDLVPDQGGRKVPPGDARALSDALVELLQSPETRESMGAHNRRQVEAMHAWPQVAAQMERVLIEAVSSGTVQRPTRAFS
jgi:glycosyltransferase involved in cell wall biosynthesis